MLRRGDRGLLVRVHAYGCAIAARLCGVRAVRALRSGEGGSGRRKPVASGANGALAARGCTQERASGGGTRLGSLLAPSSGDPNGSALGGREGNPMTRDDITLTKIARDTVDGLT